MFSNPPILPDVAYFWAKHMTRLGTYPRERGATSCGGTITRIARAYTIDLSNLEPMPGIEIIGAEAMTTMGILGRTI